MASKKTPNAIDVRIGGNIRRIRMMHGITQEKLGNQLKLTFQQVQKYEKGTNRVGGSRLVQICQILGCTTAQLTGEAKPDHAFHDYTGKQFDTRAGVDLALAWDKLSDRPKLQRTVLALVEAIANPQ